MECLTSLERAVLEANLAGDDPAISELRAQIDHLVALERRLTGVGFVTTFRNSKEGARAFPRGILRFGNVGAQIVGLAHGAGFVVYVRDGKIDMIEGYSYDEPWPHATADFELIKIPGESAVDAIHRKRDGER